MSIASRTTLTAGLRLVALASLAFALASPGLVAASSGADQEASAEETKEEWQSKYRKLLSDEALVKRNLEAARANYTRAVQRNYPRGAARQQLLIDEEMAKKDVAEVEAEIDRFKTGARRDGILPSWFYEVEDGPLDVPQPAAPAEEDPQDREGRNPLYLDSE